MFFTRYLNPNNANVTGFGNPCAEKLEKEDEQAIWDILVGVDLAGPEVSCYNSAGMDFVKYVALGLMNESKRRYQKSNGLYDKPLLFHIHVGEGFSIYYGQRPIVRANATFESVFGAIPGDHRHSNVITNPAVARNNIDVLLDAVAHLVTQHPELPRYVVFRFGHVTHLTIETATKLRDLAHLYPGFLEADVNIESNLATGAFPIAPSLDVDTMLKPYLESRRLNFKLNDLSRILVPDPTNVTRVGAVFGNFTALKYLVMNNTPDTLPVMLGTDGTGTEHAPMRRAHALAQTLLKYWEQTDPEFKKAMVSSLYFKDSVAAHQRRMAGRPRRPSGSSSMLTQLSSLAAH